MKKSKKFLVSAFFSVIGTIGLAGCDMGGNQKDPSSGSGSQQAFEKAIQSENFKETVGKEALSGTKFYFDQNKDKVAFAEPNTYGRWDKKWTWDNISINKASYRGLDDSGYMNGLVSLSISGVSNIQGVSIVSYVYSVSVASDGEITHLQIDNDISTGVWNFLNDINNAKIILDRFHGQYWWQAKNGVVSIKENEAGNLNVGATTKEEQEKGFQKVWIMNAKMVLIAQRYAEAVTINIVDGQIQG